MWKIFDCLFWSSKSIVIKPTKKRKIYKKRCFYVHAPRKFLVNKKRQKKPTIHSRLLI